MTTCLVSAFRKDFRIVRIFSLFVITMLIGLYSVNSQADVWEPSGHKQIPIWPQGKMPDPVTAPKPESIKLITDRPIAGKPWNAIYNVSQPTMTIYSPRENNTGVAIVVFPGGGFNGLAIDLEGTEVCNKLTKQGITCVLLKYRTKHRSKEIYSFAN